MTTSTKPASIGKPNTELALTEAFFEAEKYIKVIALEHCYDLNEQLELLHQIYVDEFLFDAYDFDIQIVFGAIKFFEHTAIRAMVELHGYSGYLFDSQQPNNWQATVSYAEQLEVDLQYLIGFEKVVASVGINAESDKHIALLFHNIFSITKDEVQPELGRYKEALERVQTLQFSPG